MSTEAATKRPENDDDDSEIDDDYVPEEMDDDDDEDQVMLMVDPSLSTGCHLSANKRKAVDEAFEKLFGYPFGTTFALPKRRRTSTTSITRREQVLGEIFGPSVAAHLMATSKSVRSHDTANTRASLPLMVQQQTVTEVKRFAGRNITMEKKITVQVQQNDNNTAAVGNGTTQPPSAAATTQPAKAGLDSVLREIAGPSKLSTVAKTSADWDSFKTKTGVEEELEKKAQSNQAFLVKQDFLKRVDERRFEQERAQRDAERAARK